MSSPRPAQPATRIQAHSVISSLFSLIEAPCPLQGLTHRDALTGGHSMVNILFCSSGIKRNSVSSEMLEVPYGEKNIIISLSCSCTYVLTEFLKTQGLCSQSPNQGKSSWEYSPETCSQKFRLAPCTAPHTCTACLCLLRARPPAEA